MGEHEDAVAKARIVVNRIGVRHLLVSKKRTEDDKRRGKLEMLGGHLERGESPVVALARELREEERSGTLADLVTSDPPIYRTMAAGGATHHLFEMSLSAGQFGQLEADPRESLGFELVVLSEVEAGMHRERLTYRTIKILEAFGPAPGGSM